MLLCLACYGDRLASLAENAECFRLYRVDGGVPASEGSISPSGGEPAALAATLTSCGVDELICGGMTGCTRRILTQAGITVHPWIKGSPDEVLTAWREERLESLAMPGCGGPRCGGERAGSGQGCGMGHGLRSGQGRGRQRRGANTIDDTTPRPRRGQRTGGQQGD